MTETLDKALEKVHSARAGIRSEIESITGDIARLEEENHSLPNQPASFGEVKKAILEIVAAARATPKRISGHRSSILPRALTGTWPN